MWARRAGLWQDLAGATVLAALLCAIWSVQAWPALRELHLPDTDDAVRLQQIRDWLAGQRFGDLAQHRLGAPPGLEMHWSRLPDLGPAAIIRVSELWAGRTAAELTAVIAWPALLFAAALALAARIARALTGSDAVAATALVLAALAYPATTVFMPGRIDHHGLQMVLVLLVAHRLLPRVARSGAGTDGPEPASLDLARRVRATPAEDRAGGVIAGLGTAASLTIGLETAPLLAAAAGMLVLEWIRRGRTDARLLGFGAALVAGLLLAGLALRTSGWDYPACDGFTRQFWRAAMAAATAPLLLGLVGSRLTGVGARAGTAALLSAAALAGALAASPECLHPYGGVDPLLAHAWLSGVAEAQPLFAAPPADAIGYAGLMVAGIVAASALALRTRSPGWTALLALQVTALVVTSVQLRGAYAGALLAVPALAATIEAARRRGLPAVLAAWLVSAGITYPLLARRLPQPAAAPGFAPAGCDQRSAISRLAALPPGRLLASIDLGAYALAETRHQVIAAPYHRNTAGNRALLFVVQAPTAQAAQTLRRWRVDYLALCPADLSPSDGTIAGAIRRGETVGWLERVPASGTASIYRVRRQ